MHHNCSHVFLQASTQDLFTVTHQPRPVDNCAQEDGNRADFPAWLSGSFEEADSRPQPGSLQAEGNIG